MGRWNEMLAPYRGARVVVYHDSWPYFARRFGFVIVAAVEPLPGVPPSPGSLASLTARMKDARVLVLIVEPSANRSVANRMASSSGARVVTLITSVGGDPDASGYVELFELDVRRLADAFAAGR
jgi:ABC-type Zn uptake system ZnuABC Zn-binding protein ZnuA